MKRHVLLALLRVLLTVGVAVALPFSHLQWGEQYPGDGQQEFGFIIGFMVIGFVAACVYFITATVARFIVRKKTLRTRIWVEAGVFIAFFVTLTYAGITAHYS